MSIATWPLCIRTLAPHASLITPQMQSAQPSAGHPGLHTAPLAEQPPQPTREALSRAPPSCNSATRPVGGAGTSVLHANPQIPYANPGRRGHLRPAHKPRESAGRKQRRRAQAAVRAAGRSHSILEQPEKSAHHTRPFKATVALRKSGTLLAPGRGTTPNQAIASPGGLPRRRGNLFD